MPLKGYTGISFPFRVTSRGGVALSTVTEVSPAHIAESIQQILLSGRYERPMECGDFYSDIYLSLFEPNDESLQQVLKARIVDALTRLEERIEISEDNIEFEVVTEQGVDYLYANITYKIIKYETSYVSRVKLGEVVQ